MKEYKFTAYIEQDSESGMYIGSVPGIPGAHTQGETLDELQENLKEVISLCLEELSKKEINHIVNNYVGTQRISVAV